MLPSKIRASICLPVYNGERYLAEAIESVLAQSCENFELLIADDCSQDSSCAIAESYARQEDRIRFWRHEKNKGLFANYNFLLSQASAPVVKLFAQDDVLLPDSTARSLEVLQKHPGVVLVSHARRWIDELGIDISHTFSIPQAHSFVATDTPVPGQMVVTKSIMPVVNFIGEPSTVAFRREASGSFFDARFHHLGDLDYWLRILAKGDYFYISEPLCRFRHHEKSASQYNEGHLLFLPDQLRIWRNISNQVEGLSESEFMEHMLVSGAVDVHYFEKKGQLTVSAIRSIKQEVAKPTDGSDIGVLLENYEQALDELKDFREITYRSCRLIGDRLSGLRSDTVATMYENEQKIRLLKRNRRRLLRSVPKHSPLRGINRHVALETARLQEAYMQFLRAQLRLIRTYQFVRKLAKKSAKWWTT